MSEGTDLGPSEISQLVKVVLILSVLLATLWGADSSNLIGLI